ncbi:S49 family peptidase [Roseomonas frigidaquae]|uniref:S49 family peptidase n=1 Tax=Falsiroseomonas frigidaquae TaxID=487318 RepID=A0ABX1ERY9_9PROT|nr:S49 family peptidase [Falsiroseomonas frigidaquae]NKE43390.1 S49 family peptidase [Falsiroseomonas frigidaquae]
MTDLTRLSGRIFNQPHFMDPVVLDAMMVPMRARLGVSGDAAGITLNLVPRAMDQEDEAAARQRRNRRPYHVTAQGVAVIPLLGVLVMRAGQITPDCTELRSYQSIEAEMAQALRDPDVRSLLLDFDSPGGEAAGCMELATRIAGHRGGKPIVAYVQPSAYSAAYALASAADRIVLPATGGVGSIGVVALHVDRSAEDQQRGHRYTWIAAGARKLDSNPHAPLTDAAQARIQAEVDRLYGMFVQTVARNRAFAGLTADLVRKSEAGLFFGENAVAARFADQVGSYADALRLAAELATQPGRGRVSAQRHTQGAKMEDETVPGANAQGSQGGGQGSTQPPAPDAAAIRAEAERAAQARTAGIAALCELAGQPARATTFIREGATEAHVRETLLAERAAAAQQGGELSATRPAGAGTLGSKPQGGGSTMPAAAVAASWDRVGQKAFGEKWKGF